MAQTEDIEYTVSDFATSETESIDPDQPNKSVLLYVVKYVRDCIAAHNTLDVIDPQDKKFSTDQQAAIHKQVVVHLRDIESVINDKVKELR